MDRENDLGDLLPVPALLTGQVSALSTLVLLLIDKGVLTPEEVVQRFSRSADVASASGGGGPAAITSQAIADLVNERWGKDSDAASPSVRPPNASGSGQAAARVALGGEVARNLHPDQLPTENDL